jgi:hypothetical protein
MKRRVAKVLAIVLLLSGILATKEVMAASYRTISAKLNHTTAKWYQTYRSDGHIVGCGNTAWAIVLGYWKQYKGKGRLLDGINMPYSQNGKNDPLLAPLMEDISRKTKSTYGTYKGKKWGRTLPSNMCGITNYVKAKGYRAQCHRIRGTEFDKFNHVKRMLDTDRPVIILINNPSKAFTSLHYPVIEKAEKKQKKVAGKWRDRDVRYFVNMGNGGKGKWIWVREVGKNDHPHTGSFSMLLLTIDHKGGETGSTKDVNLAACQDWCRGKGCSQCSRLPGCGVGHKTVKSFTGAGRNWYACKKRTRYQDASRQNQKDCEDWCEENDSCDKCSKNPGCGSGYKRIKKFGGKGKNWYGCRKR